MPTPTVLPESDVQQSDLHTDESGVLLYDDEAACALVLEDTDRADNFLNLNNWAAGWTKADEVYQSPANSSAFDGGPAAAFIPKWTVSNHHSSIIPKIMGGLFYEDPPFLLRPRPGTTPDVIRAKTALFAYQLEDMKFQEESERLLDQMGLLGTCIAKWGFETYTRKIKKYIRKANPNIISTPGYVGLTHEIHTEASDSFEIKHDEKQVARPWLKYVDIRTVLVEPGCRYGDIRRAKWVVYRDYPTYEDLDRLRNVEGYTIPTEAELRKFYFERDNPQGDNITMTLPANMLGYLQHASPRNYKTSADPLQNGLEILERWTDDMVIVVLKHGEHNIIIRNEANPYQKKPFYSANWRNIPDCFYGQGLGLLIGSEQIVDQDISSMALGLISYGVQPTALRLKGFNTLTQDLRWSQGGVIDVDGDDINKSFKFLEMPGVPSEAFQYLQASQAAAQETSGANQQVGLGAGAAGVKTTGMRSGTGAAAVVSANASRLDGPTERFCRQILEPWLQEMDDLNNDRLPTSVLRDVLNEKMGNDFKVDHVKFRNAQIEYEVLAGAHLGPKAEMKVALPIIEQMVGQPAIVEMLAAQGKQFDITAILKTFFDSSGFKYSQDFVIDMPPQAQQQRQANSPAAIQQQKFQAANAALKQKTDEAIREDSAKQMNKAGSEVFRTTVEKGLDSEELTGEPGDVGFGANNAG